MKRFSITTIIFLIGITLMSCGEGNMEQDTSEVTIYITESQSARLEIKKPSLLASAKHFIENLMAVNEASAIPAGITDVRYSVSGSGMSTITGVASVVNDTVKIVLYIPNGPQRRFTLDARYPTTCVRYRGVTDVDLNGRPITLNVSMTVVSTDLCPTSASNNGNTINFTINNSGNTAVANGSFYYVQYQSGSNNLCTSGTSSTIPADAGSGSAGTVAVTSNPVYPTSNNYRIIIDPLNGISETDESNNEICSGTFCTSPPPLSIC